MRTQLYALLVLAFWNPSQVVAHASGIDDFVLVGEGHTITYSLPDSAVIMDHPHGVTLGASGPATIDGISGYTVSGLYYTRESIPLGLPDIVLSGLPSSIGGQLVFFGGSVLSDTVIPISDPSPQHPDDLLVTFIPGTYDLVRSSTGFYFDPIAPYTLTITEESSAVPEPSSLILLATGAFAVTGAVCVRSRRWRTSRHA